MGVGVGATSSFTGGSLIGSGMDGLAMDGFRVRCTTVLPVRMIGCASIWRVPRECSKTACTAIDSSNAGTMGLRINGESVLHEKETSSIPDCFSRSSSRSAMPRSAAWSPSMNTGPGFCFLPGKYCGGEFINSDGGAVQKNAVFGVDCNRDVFGLILLRSSGGPGGPLSGCDARPWRAWRR